MSFKRNKRSVRMVSPSSSTPAGVRHGFITSPQALFDQRQNTKNSDANSSPDNLIANCSPVVPRCRLVHSRISPLEIDVRAANSLLTQNNQADFDSSPEHSYSIEDVSARISVNNTYLSDHLQHSLSYAKQMELRAVHLSNRLNASANLSMSPRLLFSSDNAPVKDEPLLEHKKHITLVDDFNMRFFNSISQQTTENVDRLLRFSEICPDVIKSQTPNRFASKLKEDTLNCDLSSKMFNPMFNSSCLVGTFSTLEELSRTPLAILYKARHRLNGILYCLKRSRCEYELERVHGSTLSEISNEAQALALLRHPNIIRYYFSWFETGSIFMQLEYCLGGSLFNYLHPDRSLDTSEAQPTSRLSNSDEMGSDNEVDLRDTELPIRSLSEQPLVILTAHVVSALHYMHANWSMVHGDVKPSNILLQVNKPEAFLASLKEDTFQEAKDHCYCLLQSGKFSGLRFKLADFGRASRAGEDRDGENLGDGRYLSRLNDPSPPIRAAMGRDVYALGITLYHAAGGPMAPSVWERLRETDCIPDFSVIPTSLQPIVQAMLRPLAQDRPTAPELVNWPSLRPYFGFGSEDSMNNREQEMEFD